MKLKALAATVALAAMPFFVTAAAQHADHHTAQSTDQSAAVGNSMVQGMGLQMMQLVAQVKGDLAALANESDLAVIHKKLSQDATLLEQFQGHMSGNMQGMTGSMMSGGSMMPGMMSGNMMTGNIGNCPAVQQQPQ